MPRPRPCRLVCLTLGSLGWAVLVCLPGCGDDPSRDAGKVSISAAKSQAETEPAKAGNVPSRSKTTGRARD